MRRGLTVVIPSKNVANLIPCLTELRKNEPDCRVVWVDDRDGGCWKNAEAMSVLEVVPEALVAAGPKPFIFARNVNLGILVAGKDDVVLLNDDAVLKTRGGFTAMQAAAEEHPEFGVISSTTNVANNLAQRPAGVGLRDTPRDVAFVCVLIPRRTIEAVGVLDERFTGSIDGEMVYGGEDTEYCYRVRMAGLKIGIFDGCFVDHASLKSTFRPHGGGLPITATRKRFFEIHGFQMGTR